MLAVRDCLLNLFAATLHIGGRSSIRNLRTRHAVVTGTNLTWASTTTTTKNNNDNNVLLMRPLGLFFLGPWSPRSPSSNLPSLPPFSCISVANYRIPSNSTLPSTSELSHPGLFPREHSVITFLGGYENHPFLLRGRSTVVASSGVQNCVVILHIPWPFVACRKNCFSSC